MSASQPANFNLQEFTDAGLPLVGGRLYTYVYGTTTQNVAYTDPAGIVPHTYTSDGIGGQYIALNGRGELPAPLYLGDTSYDISLKRADGSAVWTRKADGVDNTAKVGLAAFIASITSSAGASLIGFIHAAIGAVKRSVQDKLRDTISVKDFGAKGDGTTDDTAAIQAAITWRATNGGGTLLLPAGNYLISTGLTWTGNNVVLTGEGKGATTITASFATGDIITVGDGTANPNNAVIQSLRITANVAKTTGAAIRFRNGHNLKARDIRLDSNLFKGIALDGGAQHFSYYVQDFEIGASSVGIEFGSDGTQVADVFVSTGIVSGATSGLLFRNASGVYASKIDMIGCADAGIAMIPADGQGITSSFFDTVLGDTAANQGWKIIPTGTGKVADIGFVNCWGSTTQNAAGAGLYIAGPANSVSNLHFTNFRAVNNAGPGILLAQGRFITFSNCVATANSQSSSATYPGFSIVGTLTDIQITGGVYGGMNTLPQNQSYGISFGGACDYIQVLGANTRGNLTGGLINASSGTHNVVANNV